MTDCATPRHHGQDEPTPTEAGTHLCHTCRCRLRRHLTQLPTLHTILGETLTPSSHGYGNGDGLPYNDPASVCRSQIRHDLTWWATTLHEERDAPSPQPPHLDSPAFVPYLAGWLTGQLRRRPSPIPAWWRAPDLAGALADDTGRAWALIQPRTIKTITWMDLCPTCGTLRELRAVVYGTEGDRRTSYIECMTCWTREGFGPGWIKWRATARKASA